MKHLPLLACITFASLHSAPCAETPAQRLENHMAETIANQLKNATMIALCDYKLPQGMIITRTIRGNTKAVGNLWNSSQFPEAPVLAFESASDLIGNTAGIMLTSGYYPLDPSKKFIVLKSIPLGPESGTEKDQETLISIQKLEALLKAQQQN